tara:strand:- start:349 stop:573 length:225 start_codon:yes stop_codon:yes gene_type:complete
MKVLYAELNSTPNIQIKNKMFHLFFNSLSLALKKEIIKDSNKKKAPIGNADGKNNIPIKKNLLPILKLFLNNGL